MADDIQDQIHRLGRKVQSVEMRQAVTDTNLENLTELVHTNAMVLAERANAMILLGNEVTHMKKASDRIETSVQTQAETVAALKTEMSTQTQMQKSAGDRTTRNISILMFVVPCVIEVVKYVLHKGL